MSLLKFITFIKNPKYLSNDCLSDLFAYTGYTERFYEYLLSIPKNSNIALIGGRGIGKTFLINALQQRLFANNKVNEPHLLYFDVHQSALGEETWDTFRKELIRQIKSSLLQAITYPFIFIFTKLRTRIFGQEKGIPSVFFHQKSAKFSVSRFRFSGQEKTPA